MINLKSIVIIHVNKNVLESSIIFKNKEVFNCWWSPVIPAAQEAKAEAYPELQSELNVSLNHLVKTFSKPKKRPTGRLSW